MEEIVTKGAEGFGIGQAEEITRVEGGLSNEMWRVTTLEGDFAVKVMRAHVEAPDFSGNVEAAFRIEFNAFRSGVPCPEPRATLDGRALLRVDGHWLRAHRWSEGTNPDPGGRVHPYRVGFLRARAVEEACEQTDRATCCGDCGVLRSLRGGLTDER